MKKNLIILFVTLFFINIGYAKCDVKVTNDNDNSNVGGYTTAGNVSTDTNLQTTYGNFLQALKLSVYDSNNNLIKSKYLKIKFGDKTDINYYCSGKYEYDKLPSDANTSLCISKNSGGKFDYITGIDTETMFYTSNSWGYWTTYTANSESIDSIIWDEGNNHYNLLAILNAMGVTPNDGYYLIVEPVVTVKCKNNVYSGTINSLMAANVSFISSGYMKTNACGYSSNDNFVFYYSAIAQSFKTKPAQNEPARTCAQKCNGCWHGTVNGKDLWPTTNKITYTGCGYNKYDLSVLANNKCVYKDNKYYGPDGKVTTKENYEKNCCSVKANSTDPVERIKLYNQYLNDGIYYNNLLDFTKIGNDACRAVNYSHNKSCLAVSSTNTFSEDNLSQYTSTTEINFKKVYCNADFRLEKSDNINTPNFGTVLPGMAYLGGTSTQSKVATGTLTLTCYLYDAKENTDNISPFSKNNDTEYNNYIKSIELGGIPLASDQATLVTSETKYNSDKKLYTFKKVYNKNYKLPERYVSKITGYVTDKKSDDTVTKYGYYSLLDEIVTDKEVPFTITTGTSGKNIKFTDGNCYYSTSGKSFDGILEFRLIDTENPFLGSDGKGRKVGANWCELKSDGKYNCDSNNKVVKEYVLNRNNSYNVQQKQPIYKFRIDVNAIEKIKEYNKTHPIDKYDIVCDENKKCKNMFFKEIEEYIIEGKDRLIPNK